MKGIDIDKIKKLMNLVKLTGNKITIAGGIKDIEEIKIIEDLGCNSQLGMALYTGRVRLDEAFISLLRFDVNGFIPTIVQDNEKNVLMLAYSSRESLIRSFRSGKATYFSRSRNRLWTKGESSGNVQELLRARYDCDRDSLLFTVIQKNFACHQGSYSCFGSKGFCLEGLYSKIRDRGENPRPGSYTSIIFQDENMIMEKISEESEEVVNYTDRPNLIWEIADLTYFLMVLMAKKGISIEEVKNKLWGRDR
jgi:phosphoribosyl-ATP pyrophosphohydrolase/phosphoribosyl-AMP cyclohydrolase